MSFVSTVLLHGLLAGAGTENATIIVCIDY